MCILGTFRSYSVPVCASKNASTKRIHLLFTDMSQVMKSSLRKAGVFSSKLEPVRINNKLKSWEIHILMFASFRWLLSDI